VDKFKAKFYKNLTNIPNLIAMYEDHLSEWKQEANILQQYIFIQIVSANRAKVASRSSGDHDVAGVVGGPKSLHSMMLRGLRPICTRLGEWASTIGMAPASIALMTWIQVWWPHQNSRETATYVTGGAVLSKRLHYKRNNIPIVAKFDPKQMNCKRQLIMLLIWSIVISCISTVIPSP